MLSYQEVHLAKHKKIYAYMVTRRERKKLWRQQTEQHIITSLKGELPIYNHKQVSSRAENNLFFVCMITIYGLDRHQVPMCKQTKQCVLVH